MNEYGMNEFEMVKKADVMRIINAENAVVLNNLKERSTDEVLCSIASQINGLQTTVKSDRRMKQLGFEHKNDTATEIERTNDNMGLAKYNLNYLGETDTDIKAKPLTFLIHIIHHAGMTIVRRTIAPQIGFVVSYKDVEYVYTGLDKGWVAINNYRKEETETPVRYD